MYYVTLRMVYDLLRGTSPSKHGLILTHAYNYTTFEDFVDAMAEIVPAHVLTHAQARLFVTIQRARVKNAQVVKYPRLLQMR